MDKWRIERRNSYNLYCAWATNPIDITQYNPLPFDDELAQQTTLTDTEYYYLVKASGQLDHTWKIDSNGKLIQQ